MLFNLSVTQIIHLEVENDYNNPHKCHRVVERIQWGQWTYCAWNSKCSKSRSWQYLFHFKDEKVIGSETCLLGKYELGSFLFQSLNSCHTCCQYATCFCVNMMLWSLFWLLSLGCSSFVFLPSMLVSQPIKAEEGDGARFLDRIFCFQLIPSGVLQSMRCLPCCRPWGCKKSDKTEWLSWSTC